MIDRYVYFCKSESDMLRHCVRMSDVPSDAMFQTWVEFPRFYPRREEPDSEVIRRGDFWMDIDGELNDACKAVRRVYDRLTSTKHGWGMTYGRDFLIYASGGKGFHVQIDRRVVGMEDGHPLLPLIYKKFTQRAFPKENLIDPALYRMKRGQVIRRANILRANGRMKIVLTEEEVKSITQKRLLNLPQVPRDVPRLRECAVPCGTWIDLMTKYCVEQVVFNENKRKMREDRWQETRRESGYIPPCLSAILELRDRPPSGITFDLLLYQAIVPTIAESGLDAGSVLSAFIEGYEGSTTYTTAEDRWRKVNEISRGKVLPMSCGANLSSLRGTGIHPCQSCRWRIDEYGF